MKIRDKVLIVNPLAPVRVYKREDIDGEVRDFRNLDEFEAWYHPGHHGHLNGAIGVKTQFLYTDVLLDRIDDPRRGPKVSTVPRGKDAGQERGDAVVVRSGHHQKVRVDGNIYNSTWDAFQKLGLGGVKECVKFRTQLKAAGSGEYGGKKFTIEE